MNKIGLKKLVLTEDSRNTLLSVFPPRFQPSCEHITLEFGKLSDIEFSDISTVNIIGYQSSSYLEVLVVEINGSTSRDSDKQTLHITHSIQPGIPPVCSNDVLREKLWDPIIPIALEVTPQTLHFS